MDVRKRLEDLGHTLPQPPVKGGIYKPVQVIGNMAYVSGQGPTLKGVPQYTGKMGQLDLATGRKAAELCTLNCLSALQEALGSLDKVDRVVKILGFVASEPDFTKQPKVIDGCSELLQAVWGQDKGVAARSAIGVAVLPGDIPVEIEFQFLLKE